MGKQIYFKKILQLCIFMLPMITVGQNVVIKGGGVVVESSKFFVV